MTEGKDCPIKSNPVMQKFFKLPLDQQMLVFNGALVLIAVFLSSIAPGLSWLVPFIGAVMIFVGITGQCPVRKMLMKCHAEGGGSCGTSSS